MTSRNDLNEVRQYCRSLYLEYKAKAYSYYSQIPDDEKFFELGREEFGIQSSCLMHRGFYCPSPVIEHIIVNIKRGKIAKKLGNVKKPTNFYEFDTDGRLRIVDTNYPNGNIGTEYLFYEEDVVLVIQFSKGDLYQLSIEQYDGKRLKSYLLINCLYHAKDNEFSGKEMDYECYDYSAPDCLNVLRYHFMGSYPQFDRCSEYSFPWDRDRGTVRNH